MQAPGPTAIFYWLIYPTNSDRLQFDSKALAPAARGPFRILALVVAARESAVVIP